MPGNALHWARDDFTAGNMILATVSVARNNVRT
jgi:hypothetical protein